MRAVGLFTHGGPEVLQVVELPEVQDYDIGITVVSQAPMKPQLWERELSAPTHLLHWLFVQ